MKDLLSTKDLKTKLHLSAEQVRKMCRGEDIPRIRVGGVWRFDPDDIDEWLRKLKRKARTKHLEGYGGGDRRLYALEDGEFIQRKEAVRFFGVQAMNAINSMDVNALMANLIPKNFQGFADGGFVGAQQGGQERQDTVNLNLQFGKGPTLRAKEVGKQNLAAFMKDIKKMNSVHGRYRPPY